MAAEIAALQERHREEVAKWQCELTRRSAEAQHSFVQSYVGSLDNPDDVSPDLIESSAVVSCRSASRPSRSRWPRKLRATRSL